MNKSNDFKWANEINPGLICLGSSTTKWFPRNLTENQNKKVHSIEKLVCNLLKLAKQAKSEPMSIILSSLDLCLALPTKPHENFGCLLIFNSQ